MCLLPRSFLWRMTYDPSCQEAPWGEAHPGDFLIATDGSALQREASRSRGDSPPPSGWPFAGEGGLQQGWQILGAVHAHRAQPRGRSARHPGIGILKCQA